MQESKRYLKALGLKNSKPEAIRGSIEYAAWSADFAHAKKEFDKEFSMAFRGECYHDYQIISGTCESTSSTCPFSGIETIITRDNSVRQCSICEKIIK